VTLNLSSMTGQAGVTQKPCREDVVSAVPRRR
jgi:hypothetical protein